MSDWTWEYVPDSAHVVGGLTPGQCAEVEALAQRIADAVTVRMIGRPFNPEEAVSGLAWPPWPIRVSGQHLGQVPYRGKDKPESQKQANRAHAKLRAPGERRTPS